MVEIVSDNEDPNDESTDAEPGVTMASEADPVADYETCVNEWGMSPATAREYLAFARGTFKSDVEIVPDPDT